MAIERVFLGWERPAIEAAARWLIGRGGLELSGFLVVVPGARAGRVLRGALVEAVRGRVGGLSPPVVVTPGEVGGAVFRHGTAPAGDVSRRVAWMAALRRSGEQMGELLRHPPELEDVAGLSRVAGLLERLSSLVAGTGRRMSEVAEVGGSLAEFADGGRWEAAGRLQAEYEALLAERGLHDSEIGFADAVRGGEGVAQEWKVVLVGVSELAPVVREGLEGMARGRWGVECEVTALVMAEEADAGMFDELGCARVEAWGEAPVADGLGAGQVVFADGPGDQAREALGAIAGLGGRYGAEEIVVGVADEEVMASLETAGRRVEARVGGGEARRGGVRFRAASGRRLGEVGPALMVRAVGEFVGMGSYASLAALVRHPDVERWLVERKGGVGRETWLGALDGWAGERLPERAGDVFEGVGGARRGRGGSVNEVEVRWLVESVGEMAGGLVGGGVREVGKWGGEIVGLLARVYAGREMEAGRGRDREVVEACDRLREAALDLRGAAGLECGAGEAIAALLQVVSDSALATEAARESIESLGWLELALDPAPVAIVTGFNEGFVPRAAGVEPMMPEALRGALGLAMSGARAARDAYLLWAFLRSKERVVVIAGRRTGKGDPLLPSRLLFQGDAERAAGRLAEFAGLGSAVERVRARERVGRGAMGGVEAMPVARGAAGEALPESLAVTAFGRYLRSPYEFYLRDVLRVGGVEEPGEEMDGRLFGTLIHETMAGFAATDAAGSDDVGRVRQAMGDVLSGVVRGRFGGGARLSVELQVEVARRRLEILAGHQAARAAAGWRIARAEWRVEAGAVRLEVDGRTMGIHGTIDRIDRHEDGRWAVWDYKAGEKQGTPEQTHRAGRKGRRRWVDLQLPLYRVLMRGMGEGARGAVEAGRCEVGYVMVGAAEEGIGFVESGWEGAGLAEAEEVARGVVRDVWAGRWRVEGELSEDRVVRALCRGGGA